MELSCVLALPLEFDALPTMVFFKEVDYNGTEYFGPNDADKVIDFINNQLDRETPEIKVISCCNNF